jgi:hypothetical protein
MRFLETAASGYQTTAYIVETWPNGCRHCDLVETASLSRLCKPAVTEPDPVPYYPDMIDRYG